MQAKKFYYHNLGYWFLLFILLAFAGFYTTYFVIILEPMPALIHVHFVLMTLWVFMLIAQPFLIKFKKLSWHRLLGKVSYVLVPLVLITAFLLIRHGYYRDIDELHKEAIKGLKHYNEAEILKKAAKEPIALIYFIWFVLFYILAIKHRHKSPKHARYMLATALTLTGPTVDRILGIHFKIENIAGISSYIVSFLIINVMLSILLYADYQTKRETKTLWTCLIVYIVGQLLFYTVPTFDGWAAFMQLIMMPKP